MMTILTPRKAKAAARKAAQARIAAAVAEARVHVHANTCPQCGSTLRRNLALAGWYQCQRYGMDQYRAPEFRGLPACSFQCFTE